MVAEYQPATGRYFYYTTDQINSTRVVTDDSGNVVYAAVDDPYGGVQQTWANSFNPELKFSGKEQDAESGLYYFGARYYDPTLYRFLSPDPVIPTDRAIHNPQRWNLYGYCGGNPVKNLDINGCYYIIGSVYIYRQFTSGGVTYGSLYLFNPRPFLEKGYFVPYSETREKAPNKIPAGTYLGQFRWVNAKIKDESGKLKTIRTLSLVLFDFDGNPVTWTGENGDKYIGAIHTGSVDESNGCIIVDKGTMNNILSIFNYYFSIFDRTSYVAMIADQIGQVLYGFAALDWYSEYFYFHFFWVYIVDPPKQTQPAPVN